MPRIGRRLPLGLKPMKEVSLISLVFGAFGAVLVIFITELVKTAFKTRQVAYNFGQPKVQHLESYRSDEYPEAGVVTSEDRDVKDGKRIIRGQMFHTDESFIAEPPKVTVLYAVAIPSKGGNTRFVNMQKTYETLDAATQKQIDGLTAIHYYGKQRPGRKVPSMTDEQMKNTPPVEHPVVRLNEDTGAKALTCTKR